MELMNVISRSFSFDSPSEHLSRCEGGGQDREQINLFID